MKPYTPIPCDFYSHLEDFAVKKTPVTIYFQQEGTEQKLTGTIHDLFTKNGVEFLVLDPQRTIRLDELMEVNGLKLTDFESCRV